MRKKRTLVQKTGRRDENSPITIPERGAILENGVGVWVRFPVIGIVASKDTENVRAGQHAVIFRDFGIAAAGALWRDGQLSSCSFMSASGLDGPVEPSNQATLTI